MKTTISKSKTTLGGINGQLETAEEEISEVEDTTIETVHMEEWREKSLTKNEQSISCDPWKYPALSHKC